MAASSETTISRFKKTLDPYIKPREQVNYIRRVLALELGSYTGDGPIQQPLSLNDGPLEREIGPELKGVYKEFIEAIHANNIAHRQFDQIANESLLQSSAPTNPQNEGSSSSVLEDHLTLLKLRKKHESLAAIQTYLDYLSETPLACQDTINIEQALKGGKSLPSVPSSVINSFVVEQSAGRPDLQSHVNQLDKTVLRTKLLLKQEERLLAEARARCTIKPELVSNGAKLQALNNTRNELINWIETELSKASTEEEEAATQVSTRQTEQTAQDQAAISSQLQQIQDKYKEYVAARKELLKLTSQTPQPSMPPPETTAAQPSSTTREAAAPSTDFLLTPYLEALLAKARYQKALVTHKSHITASLNKQNKESCQLLGRLAEESQLLSAYPMKDSTRRRSGIPEIIAAKPTERPDIASRIKPWVFAADAAKIGTLEAVAEKIEVGQVALESSMEALHEMDMLLGLEEEQEVDEVDTTEDDMWLQGQGIKKQPRKKKVLQQHKGDPWAKIHGNLGLIGHDNAA